MSMTALPIARPSGNRPQSALPMEAGDHLDQPTFHALYKQMPPGIKAELIGGIVYMPSPVSNFHGQPNADLTGCLTVYRARTPGVGTSDNGTTILGDDSEPQPDAFMRVFSGGQSRLDEDGYVIGCPEMVCEVSNSSVSYDLHAKLHDYERYGALEYLAVIVRGNRLAWFARVGDRLVEVPPDADGIYRSRAFPGFWLDPAALLRGDAARLLEVLNEGLATPEHAAFAASLRPSPGAGSGG
jgi:Uma2 family endonuclease